MRPARFKPALLALAATLTVASAAGFVTRAHAQGGAGAAPLDLDIPAQPLAQALTALARQANLEINVPAALLAGKTAPAVSGQLTTRQAVDRLLADSGLSASIEGSAMVVKPVASAPSLAPETTLPPVRVTATPTGPLPIRQERGFRSKSSSVSGFREQEVVNTPYSTATITAEVIENQQAKSVIDVIKNDPSVTPASDPLWFDRVNVRGFDLGVDAVFRDGMSINDQGSIALENKAAVEINKGLSALRYGATSPGGTLNYVVKRPTLEPLRKISASADEHGSVGLHADLGGRFGDTQQFGYRINAATEEQRSHFDAFEGDKKFLSGFFDWQVNDRLSFELDVEHQRLNRLSVRTPSLWWWNTTQDAQAAFARLGPQTYAYQTWAHEPNEQTYLVARANYQLNDDWKASLTVHDSQLRRDQNSSSVFSAPDANGEYEADIYYSPNQERNNRAYQLVFQGDVRRGRLRHELAFGVDQLRRDMIYPEGVNEAIGFDNLFNPRGLPRPAVGPTEAGPAYLANRTYQQSVFITDNLILNEQWRLFGGLRHTRIEQLGADTAADALVTRYDKSAVNPTLGLVYKPVPAGTLYASYAEGIETGGVADGPDYTNDGEMLAPLQSKQYEVGAKWETERGALLTAALFEIDKGLEIDRNNGNGTRTLVQDGRQVHRGVEFTAGGQVARATRVVAGVAYLDPKIKETTTAALVGKRPQGVPAWQANLYADQSLNHWLPGLSVAGGVYYGGKKAIDAENTWMADSFVRLDLGARYEHKPSSAQTVTYRLNIDNVTNRRYLANTAFGSLQFGVPRTVRVSASLNF